MATPPRMVPGPAAPGSVRDRLDAARPADEQSHAFYAVLLAVAVFFFVLAISARQAAAPGPAMNVLEAGIDTIAGTDLVVLENTEQLQRAVQTTDARVMALPGYPLPVYLSRDEVMRLSQDDLRNLVLQRSAALVYTRGLGVFDQTGNQSLGTFSNDGVLRFVAAQVSDDAYTRANVASVVLAVITALAAAAVVLRQSGFRRLRLLGTGIAGGALPGLVLFVALRLVASAMGGGDDFARGLRGIADSLIDVPLRNYAIVLILGVLIVLLSPLLAFAVRRVPALRPAPGPEAVPVEAFDDDE